MKGLALKLCLYFVLVAHIIIMIDMQDISTFFQHNTVLMRYSC